MACQQKFYPLVRGLAIQAKVLFWGPLENKAEMLLQIFPD